MPAPAPASEDYEDEKITEPGFARARLRRVLPADGTAPASPLPVSATPTRRVSAAGSHQRLRKQPASAERETLATHDDPRVSPGRPRQGGYSQVYEVADRPEERVFPEPEPG